MIYTRVRDYEDRQTDTDMEKLVTWLMTFGSKAEVLELKEALDIIRRNAEELLQIYMED